MTGVFLDTSNPVITSVTYDYNGQNVYTLFDRGLKTDLGDRH